MKSRTLASTAETNDPLIPSLRARYGFNSTQRNVHLEESPVKGRFSEAAKWRIAGKVVVDNQPICHAIIVEGEDLVDHYRKELVGHLRMFADAYADGVRWEDDACH